MNKYLKQTDFLDFGEKIVQDFALLHTNKDQTDTEKAIALYLAVRDGFYYNPYVLDLTKNGLKSSNILGRNYGYCVEKAVLLASLLRCVGIPSRLFFGNVQNHIATEKLELILGTNLLVFHGACEIYLNEKWVKATPAFNKELCAKLNVSPLEFDGVNDSLFQQFNKTGTKFMEYKSEYGSFDDMPFSLYLSEIKKHYAHLLNNPENEKNGLYLTIED
jgi:transglutaminase-like putative cysteine protease